MKFTGIALLLLMLAAPGCLPMPVLPDQTPLAAPVVEKDKDKEAAPRPVVVKAEDIDEKNAHEKANALQAELDRAAGDSRVEGKPLKVRP